MIWKSAEDEVLVCIHRGTLLLMICSLRNFGFMFFIVNGKDELFQMKTAARVYFIACK